MARPLFVDYLGAAHKTFGSLASSVTMDAGKTAVTATNARNVSGAPISVTVPVTPKTTFGPRLFAAMIALRDRLDKAAAP